MLVTTPSLSRTYVTRPSMVPNTAPFTFHALRTCQSRATQCRNTIGLEVITAHHTQQTAYHRTHHKAHTQPCFGEACTTVEITSSITSLSKGLDGRRSYTWSKQGQKSSYVQPPSGTLRGTRAHQQHHQQRQTHQQTTVLRLAVVSASMANKARSRQDYVRRGYDSTTRSTLRSLTATKLFMGGRKSQTRHNNSPITAVSFHRMHTCRNWICRYEPPVAYSNRIASSSCYYY